MNIGTKNGEDTVVANTNFEIGLADTDADRVAASRLINKMYSWRGYGGLHHVDETPHRVTLTASAEDNVVGTVTLGFDSPAGILADETFKEEIDIHRKKGRRVCEFTKLAFDQNIRSKAALASLFHTAFIHCRHVRRSTDIFIEVNPRHSRFYEMMLGFKRLGEVKVNPRVNAPACLLWVSLDYVERQIETYGGTGNCLGVRRSLYPYFLSSCEEDGIVQSLGVLNF